MSCLPRLQAPLLRGGMETKKDDDTESRGGCPICQPRETIPKSERMELKAFALKSFGFWGGKSKFLDLASGVRKILVPTESGSTPES